MKNHDSKSKLLLSSEVLGTVLDHTSVLAYTLKASLSLLWGSPENLKGTRPRSPANQWQI